MTHILVTGAGGFVGGHVADALTRSGYSVLGLLGPTDIYRPAAAKLIAGDISDAALLERHMDGVSSIVHAAGPAAVADSFSHPADYARSHVVGSATIAGLAARHGIDRFILVSSAEIYGAPSDNPVPESALSAPISPYGAAKFGAEWQVLTILGAGPTRITLVRPFSLYGSRMRESSVVGRICEAVRRQQPVRLQTLRPVRDYLHIHDFSALILYLLQATKPPSLVNACSGYGVSVGDLARIALMAVGRTDEPQECGAPARPNDVSTLIGSNDIARSMGWVPTIVLNDGIRSLILP